MERIGLTRELMALKAAEQLEDGMYVNLGIGLPSLVSDFIPNNIEVVLQSENGILGMSNIAKEEDWDPDLVNASGNPINVIPGVSYFDSALSFGMIRAGHIDICFLGAYQVSEQGDLANWRTATETKGGSVGGAMDLAAGAKKVIVLMDHITRSGIPRIVKECSIPVTAKKVVRTIITNLALMEVADNRLIVKEIAPGISIEDIKSLTEPDLIIAKDIQYMNL